MASDFEVSNLSHQNLGYSQAGGKLYLSYDVTNYDAFSSTTTVDVYVSQDAILDESDVLVRSNQSTGFINSLATRSYDLSIRVPDGVAQGTYYAFVENDISDANAANDVSNPLAFQITENYFLFPDVVVTGLTIDATNYAFNGTLNYTVDYANYSYVGTPEGFYVTVGISDGSATDDGPSFGFGAPVAALAPGESASYSGSIALSQSSWEGETLYISATLETDDNFTEYFDVNNSSEAVKFTVDGAYSDTSDNGFHVGWYYEVKSVLIEEISYHLGWYNSWFWDNGYYLANNGSGWAWNFGWHQEYGLNFSWGTSSTYSWHYQLTGNVLLATGNESNWGSDAYYGWANSNLGLGIGANINEFDYISQVTSGSAPDIGAWGAVMYASGFGWHYDYGWTWSGGAYSMGWYLDYGVYANFYAEEPSNFWENADQLLGWLT